MLFADGPDGLFLIRYPTSLDRVRGAKREGWRGNNRRMTVRIVSHRRIHNRGKRLVTDGPTVSSNGDRQWKES
jgi:hypothetical protein